MYKKAYAKINLRLKVIDKTRSGYHNLEMINAKIDLYDEIEIKITKNLFNQLFFLNCNLDPKIDNLILRLIEYIQKKYNINDYFDIIVNKKIPIGAGLGGGSADCATILLFLNQNYNLNLPIDELIRIGMMFGSDIPYCLYNEICLVKGIGEKIYPLNYKIVDDIIVVFPNIFLSTKNVFNNFKKANNFNEFRLDTYDYMENDLEQASFLIEPKLRNVKKYLEELGFIKVMMTGSGSAFIGITKKEQSDYIYKKIKKETNWFVSKNKIYEV